MENNRLEVRTRGAVRTRTRICGTVRYYNQAARGRVIDLSASGMALELDSPFNTGSGSRVRFESDELGILEGTVQWSRGGRLGIKLNLNSNALAQVSSYFRFFHTDVKPGLAR